MGWGWSSAKPAFASGPLRYLPSEIDSTFPRTESSTTSGIPAGASTRSPAPTVSFSGLPASSNSQRTAVRRATTCASARSTASVPPSGSPSRYIRRSFWSVSLPPSANTGIGRKFVLVVLLASPTFSIVPFMSTRPMLCQLAESAPMKMPPSVIPDLSFSNTPPLDSVADVSNATRINGCAPVAAIRYSPPLMRTLRRAALGAFRLKTSSPSPLLLMSLLLLSADMSVSSVRRELLRR